MSRDKDRYSNIPVYKGHIMTIYDGPGPCELLVIQLFTGFTVPIMKNNVLFVIITKSSTIPSGR